MTRKKFLGVSGIEWGVIGTIATILGLITVPQFIKEREPGRVVSMDNSRDRNALTISVENDEGKGELRISNYALGQLEQHGIPRDVALSYDLIGKSLSSPIGQIGSLFDNGVTPEIDSSYAPRFRKSTWDLIKLHKNGITPETASQFAMRYDADEIVRFLDSGVDAETANAYDAKFDNVYGGEAGAREPMILFFNSQGVSPKNANKYLTQFWDWGVDDLVLAGIGPDLALSYDKGFTSRDIIALNEESVGPESANRYMELNKRYGAKISANDIIFFRDEGMSYDDIATQSKRNALEQRVREHDSK